MSSMTNQPHISQEGEEECQIAMQLASASVLPMVMKAASELDLFEIIAKAGPSAHLSPLEIASHLPTHNPEAPDMLDRILRLLASHSVLTCSLSASNDGRVQRLYGLAPACRYFVKNQDGVSLAPLLHLIQDNVNVNSWYHLKDAVLEGGLPFYKAYGMNSFEYVGRDPRLTEIFRSSMSDYNLIFMKKILGTYKGFEGLKVLVDVGGGAGVILNMIISKYPSIKGINFDLPQMIEKAPSYSGVEHVGGDMFVNVPKGGDAIFMKWILHSWSDEHCLKILKNCHEALPQHGKAIVVELISPTVPETSVTTKSTMQFDLFMMNMNPGGKERTEEEFTALAKEAGFAGTRVMCCAFNFSVIEFYKQI